MREMMVRNLLLIAALLLGASITFAGEAQDKKDRFTRR